MGAFEKYQRINDILLKEQQQQQKVPNWANQINETIDPKSNNMRN